ncbi:ankyrin repeats (3 copies) domain-containing protein [Trichoderma breve]|uniref:Ankyrin repeats (3 copies) domain-containing protein n=1 Tax=Trichoderma breve TaxID=2034170 RepID=A0A9W9BBJ0_9HYPO|nr:ankyrin repeats (3 copies) domain-containing protein [Trichoderma breve]KAJ4860213.1 ankyrin repeats (3 copies) domain-containing protein [Trichoderma breve]
MSLEQLASSQRKAFVFIEDSTVGFFKAHSCGNGRFIQGDPSADLEICFSLHKNKNSLIVHIHDDNLLQWLRAISSLRGSLRNNSPGPFISMDRLLPRYPEMSAKFNQDRREGHSFDALDLFVRHFLREGSTKPSAKLTSPISRGQFSPTSSGMSPPRSQLQAAIEERDPVAVDKVLATYLAFVDTKTLYLAMHYYEETVFRLLLKHGAQVGGDDIFAKLLYSAAKAGLMDAVQLLLAYDANKEGGDSCISTTALNGAASGGHLEIIQYLVEEKGANINGNEYMCPLARAIKYRHKHIIDYLLDAGANVLSDKYLVLLPRLVRTKQIGLDEILGRFRTGMNDDARDRLFLTAVSRGRLDIVRYLVAAGANVNPDTRHCSLLSWSYPRRAVFVRQNGLVRFGRSIEEAKNFPLCGREHSPPLAVAASNGYLEIVRCLVEAGADVNPYTHHRGDSIAKDSRCIRPHYSPLAAAVSEGHLDIVRYLVAAGANVNPDTRHCRAAEGSSICHREHSSPLAVAASKGYLEIVRCLVEAGAYVNPYNSTMKYAICTRPRYSPLAAAIKSNKSEVAQFLSSIGAALSKNEGKGSVLDDSDDLYPSILSGKPRDTFKRREAIAGIRARDRRTMARKLLAKVAKSCKKLLDASATQDASAGVIAYVDQLGTSASIWERGTRAIREIYEGYKPRSLSDIVSALQVANAMRAVVKTSGLGYSKKEFINDIPRWASLVSPDDRRLFFEIASYLWGIPASTVAYELADSLASPLMSLQDMVKHLVRTPGLFDLGSGNSYRLQTLRQQYSFEMSPTNICERNPTLAEWHPLPKQTVQESPHTDAPKPPDPEWEELSILARITVLVAGAIFGVILLYLCLSRYGFSTLCLPILTSDGGDGRAPDQIITRNTAILAIYVGFTSPVDFESCKSTDHLVPDCLPTETAQEPMATAQAPYEGDYPMIDPSE